jgi:hypothetical protein
MATLNTAIMNQFRAQIFSVPTETKECDGTLDWESTTLLLIEIEAQGKWQKRPQHSRDLGRFSSPNSK